MKQFILILNAVLLSLMSFAANTTTVLVTAGDNASYTEDAVIKVTGLSAEALNINNELTLILMGSAESGYMGILNHYNQEIGTCDEGLTVQKDLDGIITITGPMISKNPDYTLELNITVAPKKPSTIQLTGNITESYADFFVPTDLILKANIEGYYFEITLYEGITKEYGEYTNESIFVTINGDAASLIEGTVAKYYLDGELAKFEAQFLYGIDTLEVTSSGKPYVAPEDVVPADTINQYITNATIGRVSGLNTVAGKNNDIEIILQVRSGNWLEGATDFSYASYVKANGTQMNILRGSLTVVEEEDVKTATIGVLCSDHVWYNITATTASADTTDTAEIIEINITDAKTQFDDLNGMLLVTATWENYPVLLSIAGYEETSNKVFEGPEVSVINIGIEDNWYDYAVTNSVTVKTENDRTIFTGEYISEKNGTIYAVTIATEAQNIDDGVIYEAFELTDLVVTPMDGFIMLEASYEDLGLYVVLGVYEDGSLHEDSSIELLGASTPILGGSVVKAYNEELGTDVYTARIVIRFNGGKMGLELTMYGSAATEIIITEAEAIANEKTGALELTAVWENYPVLLTVAGYEETDYKEYEAPQVSELTIGNDDNWYDFAVANMVAITKDGLEVTIEGEYSSAATGKTYNVIVFGTMLDTAVDNLEIIVKAVKVFKNGQLIINKDNQQYNATGAIVK